MSALAMLPTTVSWATTQVTMVVAQLLLLPLQVRLWGIDGAAAWNTLVAVTALLSVADLGLRGFGHASLAGRHASESVEAAPFAPVWALVRVVVGAMLLLVVGAALTVDALNLASSTWVALWLAVAFLVEALIVARGTYMDSLRLIASGEASYALMSVTRLVGALIALLVFEASPTTLAAIYAASAAGGLAVQGLALGRGSPLSLGAGGFRAISPHTIGLLRYSVAQPMAMWCRVSLPVLVLNAIASGAIVNAYVALRAIFGMARHGVNLFSRMASVEYAACTSAKNRRRRLLLWIFASTAVGTSCALAVALDSGLLLSMWVPGTSAPGYTWVLLGFALGAPFLGTQVLLMSCMRDGGERRAAQLHYAYIALAIAAALATLMAGSLQVHFAFAVLCEVGFALAVLAFTREQAVAVPFLRWAVLGAGCVLAGFATAQWTQAPAGIFDTPQLLARAAVFATVVGWICAQLVAAARRTRSNGAC